MMRLAVMQPYIFPYLGYYQLVRAVNQFILFDDVNFIKRGWIHRNALLMQGKRHRFTIPLHQASQNKTIRETNLHPVEYPIWRGKFLKTLQQSYHHSQHFSTAYGLVKEILYSDVESVADLAKSSIARIMDYLGIKTDLTYSSDIPYKRTGNGQDKILSICQIQQASVYINAIGGEELYDPIMFTENGVELRFLRSKEISYSQSTSHFVPHLSIIDTLMHCSVSEIQNFLEQYELVTKTSTHETR